MNNAEQPPMTNVKGYFNPNPYRVNVSISELNMSVQLEPMQFVLERGTNRKINDPILDRYVGPKMLSPEISDKPVRVVKIPVVAAPVPAAAGYVVGQGHRDKTGKWVPPTVASQPPQATATPDGRPIVSSNPSIRGMSMEEARKQGFIGKQRLVPEDYGAAESDGAPTRGDAIPKIKYSMESTAPRAKAGNLPKELLEGVRPELAPVIQNMASAAQASPEAPVDMSRKAAEEATRQQLGETGVQKFRQTVKSVKAAAKAVVAAVTNAPVPAPVPAQTPVAAVAAPAPQPIRRVAKPAAALASSRRVAEVLPPPPMEELSEAPQSPLVGGSASDLPQPELGEPEEGAEEAAPAAEAKGNHKCPGCDKTFSYRSYMVRHIKRAHKDRLEELLGTP